MTEAGATTGPSGTPGRAGSEPTSLNDALARLADGDRSAFDAVYERAWPLVERVAGRFVDRTAAEDVAQRVLLRVFERANQYDRSRDAATWIVALAVWETRTELRRKRRRRKREAAAAEAPEPLDPRPSPEDEVLRWDDRRALRETLAQLSALDAETLAMFAHGRRPPGAAFRNAFSGRSRACARAGRTGRRMTEIALYARARRAYEVGRLSTGLRWGAAAAAVAALGLFGCSRKPAALAAAAAIGVLTALFEWRGQDVRRGARAGLAAGLAPFFLPLCASWIEGYFRGAACPPTFEICLAGGLLGGLVLAASRRKIPATAAFWLPALAIAATAGSIGCLSAGLAGLAGMSLGLAAGLLPGLALARAR